MKRSIIGVESLATYLEIGRSVKQLLQKTYSSFIVSESSGNRG